jgi:hypothetical protein
MAIPCIALFGHWDLYGGKGTHASPPTVSCRARGALAGPADARLVPGGTQAVAASSTTRAVASLRGVRREGLFLLPSVVDPGHDGANQTAKSQATRCRELHRLAGTQLDWQGLFEVDHRPYLEAVKCLELAADLGGGGRPSLVRTKRTVFGSDRQNDGITRA